MGSRSEVQMSDYILYASNSKGVLVCRINEADSDDDAMSDCLEEFLARDGFVGHYVVNRKTIVITTLPLSLEMDEPKKVGPLEL